MALLAGKPGKGTCDCGGLAVTSSSGSRQGAPGAGEGPAPTGLLQPPSSCLHCALGGRCSTVSILCSKPSFHHFK